MKHRRLNWPDPYLYGDRMLDGIRLDAMCVCGAFWGEHNGPHCPSGSGTFQRLTTPPSPQPSPVLPTGYEERKALPIATGVLDYFPKALAAVAHCSKVGNDQHNPGEPLHWAREKSTDEANTLIRHFIERGTLDSDGVRHSAKVAWRALALLEKEIEADAAKTPGPYSNT